MVHEDMQAAVWSARLRMSVPECSRLVRTVRQEKAAIAKDGHAAAANDTTCLISVPAPVPAPSSLLPLLLPLLLLLEE